MEGYHEPYYGNQQGEIEHGNRTNSNWDGTVEVPAPVPVCNEEISSSGRRRDDEKSRSSRRSDRSESSSHPKDRMRSRDKDSSSRHEKRRKEKKRHKRKSSSRCSKSRSRASSDEYSDHHGDSRWDYKTQDDSYKHEEPNNTIMVRGLAIHLTENDIRQDVFKCGIMLKDIRLVRNHHTGASRGFAFVEFNSVGDAARWMDMKKGVLFLHDQYQADLVFSIAKIPSSDGLPKFAADWFCERCHGQNFKRREFCYKCHAPRPDDFDDEISSHPTSTIILSNLDTLTTEEGVLQSFQCRPSMASLPIKNVKIAREPDTSLSRGICYVQANNVTEASRLFAVLSQENLEIDGRTVSVAYGKSSNNSATLLKNSNAAAAAVAAAQWTNSRSVPGMEIPPPAVPPCTQVKSENDVEKMAQYSASIYAKTTEEYASYLEYYRGYYKTEMAKGCAKDTTPKGGHQINQNPYQVVAASVRKAVFTANHASRSQSSFGWSDKQDLAAASVGVPDTSGYQYDETSGYYFDPASGFYYDATTQYFYDAEKQQFLHWSPQDQKYVAVSGSCDGNSSEKVDILNGVIDMKRKEKKVEKQDKVKVAKRTANEMEKWAKTLNQKKDATVRQPPPSSMEACSSLASMYASSYTTSSSTKPSFLDQDYRAENISTHQVASTIVDIIRRSQSENDGGRDEDKLEFSAASKESSFVDETKLACLLCKRRFASMEMLQKHIKMSDLHKKNLEGARREKLKDLSMQGKKDLSTSTVEEPTRSGIKNDNDNIGNRMLQRMGWQEGQGLGRDNQGRVDIIMAERRAGKFGVGIRPPEVLYDTLDPQKRPKTSLLSTIAASFIKGNLNPQDTL